MKSRLQFKFKYGVEIPRNYQHVLELDALNGNNLWQNAIDTELDQIDALNNFEDIGHKDNTRPPDGFFCLRVHFVFDVRHDGRCKARLNADGHLILGVVIIRGIRILAFLAKLNNLELWSTDINNAFLRAFTKEKLYVIAGSDMGNHRLDHLLVLHKALYGLWTSAARWNERLFDCLKFAIAMVDPKAFVESLKTTYGFKFEGTGPISVHLGMDLQHDEDETLYIS
jgi:hypothetical protein